MAIMMICLHYYLHKISEFHECEFSFYPKTVEQFFNKLHLAKQSFFSVLLFLGMIWGACVRLLQGICFGDKKMEKSLQA